LSFTPNFTLTTLTAVGFGRRKGTAMKPLNELLFHQLKEAFGHVRIANEGEPIKIEHVRDWAYRKGRLRAQVVHNGETYYVSCPFCTDTRQRLAINHSWGVRDEETNDDMLHLAHCFNENCANSRDVQKELHAMVYPKGTHARNAKLPPKPTKAEPPPPAVPISLPIHTALAKLPKSHPAISYLLHRKFDPERLSARWGVSFCPANLSVKPHFCVGRILMPVYGLKTSLFASNAAAPEQVLAGWQARTLEPNPPKDVPKYLTSKGMQKSRLLYGLPQAIKSTGAVVVVEGVTDAWRVGPGGVALFGKSISTAQVKLLLRHFAGRPIVVLLDADARGEAELVWGLIEQFRLQVDSAPVVLGTLPPQRKDPGDCTRAELAAIIKNTL
jgi:hypothetical protein